MQYDPYRSRQSHHTMYEQHPSAFQVYKNILELQPYKGYKAVYSS